MLLSVLEITGNTSMLQPEILMNRLMLHPVVTLHEIINTALLHD